MLTFLIIVVFLPLLLLNNPSIGGHVPASSLNHQPGSLMNVQYNLEEFVARKYSFFLNDAIAQLNAVSPRTSPIEALQQFLLNAKLSKSEREQNRMLNAAMGMFEPMKKYTSLFVQIQGIFGMVGNKANNERDNERYIKDGIEFFEMDKNALMKMARREKNQPLMETYDELDEAIYALKVTLNPGRSYVYETEQSCEECAKIGKLAGQAVEDVLRHWFGLYRTAAGNDEKKNDEKSNK